jgi:L-asparagine oxygenase
VAILSGPQANPEIRATFYEDGTKGITQVAEDAKQRLANALEHVVVPLKVEEKMMVILHNYLCVHGRSPFTPRFDGYDRHLLRSYVLPDLWSVRDLQTQATRILERVRAQ